MWEHLYGILAAVVLCMWKVEKADAQPSLETIPDLHLFSQFYAYHDADLSYHKLQRRRPEEILNRLESYALRISQYYHHLISKEDILRQYSYIHFPRHERFFQIGENMRKQIMLNAFLTLEAYLTAVIYRVCSFFYLYINIDRQKSYECYKLYTYMEWYFTFMFEEKVQDFCNISVHFEDDIEDPNRLKAENMCKILGKLDMNFLKFPNEEVITPFQEDDNNIYNPDELSIPDSHGRKHFVSIFERYLAFERSENQGQDNYEKTEYDKIMILIKKVYTNNFATLLNYFSQVTTGIPHPPNIKPTIPEFESVKIMWDYTPTLLEIMNLLPNLQRGVILRSATGNLVFNAGRIIYRSNAIEILRQIAYYAILRKFPNSSERVSEIIKNINSPFYFQCTLSYASPTLSADYWFQIPIDEEVAEFLRQNPN